MNGIRTDCFQKRARTSGNLVVCNQIESSSCVSFQVALMRGEGDVKIHAVDMNLFSCILGLRIRNDSKTDVLPCELRFPNARLRPGEQVLVFFFFAFRAEHANGAAVSACKLSLLLLECWAATLVPVSGDGWRLPFG